MTTKLICENRRCGWKGMQEEALSAPNPFDAEQLLLGCPKCKCTDLLFVACDEPGCWKPVSCGTPTKNGYRKTCGKHWPKKRDKPMRITKYFSDYWTCCSGLDALVNRLIIEGHRFTCTPEKARLYCGDKLIAECDFPSRVFMDFGTVYDYVPFKFSVTLPAKYWR